MATSEPILFLKPLKGQLKKLSTDFIKKSALVYFTTIVYNLISFITMIYIGNKLSKSDFGIAALTLSISSFILPLISFSNNSLLDVSFFKEERRVYFVKFYSSLSFVFSAIVILYILIYIIGIQRIGEILNMPYKYLLFIPALAFSNYVYNLVNGLFIIVSAKANYSINIILISMASLLITFLTFKFIEANGLYRILVYLTTMLFVSIVSFLYYMYKSDIKYSLNFDFSYFFVILKNGYPLIIHAFGGMTLLFFDKMYLNKALGAENLGVYSLAFTFASITSSFVSSLGTVFTPHIYEHLRNNDFSIMGSKKTKGYIIISIISVLAPIILFLTVNKYAFKYKYTDSFPHVIIISFAQSLMSIYYIYSSYFFFSEKFKTLSIITISNAIFFMLLVIILMQFWGIYGASFSVLIVGTTYPISTYLMYKKTAKYRMAT